MSQIIHFPLTRKSEKQLRFAVMLGLAVASASCAALTILTSYRHQFLPLGLILAGMYVYCAVLYYHIDRKLARLGSRLKRGIMFVLAAAFLLTVVPIVEYVNDKRIR